MMNPGGWLVVRGAASLAAVLFVAAGCGSDHADLFGSSADSGTGAGGSAGTGGAGGATSGTGMTTGSMATGTGGTGGCQEVSWYCDGDNDGYGDPNVSQTACDPPAGGDAKCPGPYLASNNDCGPGDPAAHPDQMSYFGTPILLPPVQPPVSGLPFDYNCDGQEEKDPSQLYKGGMNLSCSFNECFTPTPPQGFGPNAQCGGKAEYYQCTYGFGSCMLSMGSPAEPLRCR